jgi:hypothetical protein
MSVTPIEPWADPTYDVCLWPVDPACLTEDWNGLSPADQTRALAFATATLRRLTGYRVGGCPITVRPCSKSCAEGYGQFVYGSGAPTFVPHIGLEGRWVNACGCRTSCSCSQLCQVSLPLPVGEIIEVTVGADDITADTKVIDGKLTWIGAGECPFPACQDLTAAPGQPDTFAVTYRNSYPVDGLGANAVALLAMEFAKACAGKTCKLPRGTKRVTRQGVSIEVVAGSFPDDLTGIEAVDAFILLWRPKGSPKWAPRIWTPGM